MWEQMEEILFGLEANLNVLIYAKPEYSWEQMQIIFFGLKDNLDVSSYANEKFTAEKMIKIREDLLAEKYAII